MIGCFNMFIIENSNFQQVILVVSGGSIEDMDRYG